MLTYQRTLCALLDGVAAGFSLPSRQMDLPDEIEDLDLTLRHVSRRFPAQLARALLPPGAVITAVAMTVVADKDKRQRGLRGAIISVLGEEVVMESWVFKKGREQGEQRSVVRLFEMRLSACASS